MSLHGSRRSPAGPNPDLQLLQGLLAQRLYLDDLDRQLLRTLLAETPPQSRPRRTARRSARRIGVGTTALVFGGALALMLGSPLLPASAASRPAVAIGVVGRAADNAAPQAGDALLRALLNSAPSAPRTAATAGSTAARPEAALAQAELSVGQMLMIPAMQPAAGALAAPEQQNARSYLVRPGDTLSAIAQFFYGNGDLWPTIYNANTDKIADPHWIYPNQQLLIPTAGTTGSNPQNPPPQTGQGMGQYTVRAGDTLSAIAANAYGDGSAWQRIYQANTNIIANPNLIYPGQVLRIP